MPKSKQCIRRLLMLLNAADQNADEASFKDNFKKITSH
jgi:hypothetical protein